MKYQFGEKYSRRQWTDSLKKTVASGKLQKLNIDSKFRLHTIFCFLRNLNMSSVSACAEDLHNKISVVLKTCTVQKVRFFPLKT